MWCIARKQACRIGAAWIVAALALAVLAWAPRVSGADALPDLSTSAATVWPTRVHPGQVVTHTITITNSGDLDAAVWMTDVLPVGLSFILDTLTHTLSVSVVVTGDTLAAQVESLPGGAAVTLTFAASAQVPGITQTIFLSHAIQLTDQFQSYEIPPVGVQVEPWRSYLPMVSIPPHSFEITGTLAGYYRLEQISRGITDSVQGLGWFNTAWITNNHLAGAVLFNPLHLGAIDTFDVRIALAFDFPVAVTGTIVGGEISNLTRYSNLQGRRDVHPEDAPMVFQPASWTAPEDAREMWLGVQPVTWTVAAPYIPVTDPIPVSPGASITGETRLVVLVYSSAVLRPELWPPQEGEGQYVGYNHYMEWEWDAPPVIRLMIEG